MAWCVVLLKPKQEQIGIEQINAQGFKTFRPMLHKKHKDGIKTIPMFGRYLFVELTFAFNERWQVLNSTRGVIRVITSVALKPSILPVGWVENMIRQGDVIKDFSDVMQFKVGETLQIMDGPFEGQVGVCHSIKNNNRLAVLFYLLGKETVVVCSPDAAKRLKNA